LAVQLGIKRSSNLNEWKSLLEELKACKYQGVYHDYKIGGFWWLEGLFDWWSDNFKESKSIQLLTAKERVTLINERYGFSFEPINVPSVHSSSKFWHVCAFASCDTHIHFKQLAMYLKITL